VSRRQADRERSNTNPLLTLYSSLKEVVVHSLSFVEGDLDVDNIFLGSFK
jgi:hypothetical protein